MVRPPGPAQPPAPQSAPVHVTFSLGQEDLDRLTSLAASLSIEPVELVRRAIADELWIQTQIDRGGTFLLKDSRGTYREVQFR